MCAIIITQFHQQNKMIVVFISSATMTGEDLEDFLVCLVNDIAVLCNFVLRQFFFYKVLIRLLQKELFYV